jgi:hypothetical protein
MAAITAHPTEEGLEILNSEMLQNVKEFILVGETEFVHAGLDTLLEDASVLGYEDVLPYAFARLVVESAFYDEAGVLTFHLNLPYDVDYSKYIYGIGLLHVEDGVSKLVSLARTPKVAKVAGVGGSFTYKVAVLGQGGEVVFKVHDYVTTSELEYAIDFQNLSIIANARAITDLTNRLIQQGVINV